MDGAALALESSFAMMAREEAESRIWAVNLETSVGTSPARPSLAPELSTKLQELRDFQQLVIAVAAVHEATDELGIATWARLTDAAATILDLARRIAGFDPQPVLVRVPRKTSPARDPSAPVGDHLVTMVSLAKTMVSSWPIDVLERVGHSLGVGELAHSLRLGHAWLNAFALRHSSGDNRALRAAGRAYSESRLTLEEVALILGGTVPDALAWLDANGFGRGVDAMRLSDEARALAFSRLRADRLERGGRPVFDQQFVARDVIATQRIEDVDARPWIPTR